MVGGRCSPPTELGTERCSLALLMAPWPEPRPCPKVLPAPPAASAGVGEAGLPAGFSTAGLAIWGMEVEVAVAVVMASRTQTVREAGVGPVSGVGAGAAAVQAPLPLPSPRLPRLGLPLGRCLGLPPLVVRCPVWLAGARGAGPCPWPCPHCWPPWARGTFTFLDALLRQRRRQQRQCLHCRYP